MEVTAAEWIHEWMNKHLLLYSLRPIIPPHGEGAHAEMYPTAKDEARTRKKPQRRKKYLEAALDTAGDGWEEQLWACIQLQITLCSRFSSASPSNLPPCGAALTTPPFRDQSRLYKQYTNTQNTLHLTDLIWLLKNKDHVVHQKVAENSCSRYLIKFLSGRNFRYFKWLL